MYLPALTDEELVRFAEQSIDPLTTSDLERELIARFDKRLGYADLDKVLYDNDMPLGTAVELLRALSEHGVDSVNVLQQKLKRAEAFYAVAQDAGDVVEREAA